MTQASRTAGTGTDFRTLPQAMFPAGAARAAREGKRASPLFPKNAGPGTADRSGHLFEMNGIDLSPDETHELELLQEFLGHHVLPCANGDVQCMLLWNEWVRKFRHQTSAFPDLIREKEFRSAITGTFGTGIATDGWRGAVYPGLRFVP